MVRFKFQGKYQPNHVGPPYNYYDSVHIGKNALGNTFRMALQEYDAIIAKPFQQFLRTVYCKYLFYV
jgi:hypothetical protein